MGAEPRCFSACLHLWSLGGGGLWTPGCVSHGSKLQSSKAGKLLETLPRQQLAQQEPSYSKQRPLDCKVSPLAGKGLSREVALHGLHNYCGSWGCVWAATIELGFHGTQGVSLGTPHVLREGELEAMAGLQEWPSGVYCCSLAGQALGEPSLPTRENWPPKPAGRTSNPNAFWGPKAVGYPVLQHTMPCHCKGLWGGS